jgi:ubiquinone/menaquinone biosynthesis C-methylase UbiE
MPTDIDPAFVEPSAILQAADFHGAHVLEVGAGDGRLTFRYAPASASVVGIDTKHPDIASAARDPRAAPPARTHFLCASATALPFPAETFDIVLLASSL